VAKLHRIQLQDGDKNIWVGIKVGVPNEPTNLPAN
jgi:hypothetical protein